MKIHLPERFAHTGLVHLWKTNKHGRKQQVMRTKSILAPIVTLALTASLPTSSRADIISDWNATAIRILQTVGPHPQLASRSLAMTHVAQFDAVNAVVGCYEPYAARLSAPSASPEVAAAQAAYRVLATLYPSQLSALDAALAESLAAVPDG